MINDRVSEMGTTVMIEEISKEYEDGKMDIKTQGLKVFKVLEMVSELPEKLYSGAIVNYPDNLKKGNRELMQALVRSVRELHRLLKLEKDFKKPDDMLWTYDVAHHAGLSLVQEYGYEVCHDSF